MSWENLDEYERAAYLWQYNLHGGFYKTLWKAIMLADNENLSKLRLAFPIEVEAFIRYSTWPNWWPNVMKKYGGGI